MTNNAELVLSIVNQGFEEKVIDCARGVGVTGGTFVSAKGSASVDAEKFFGISITPEKQIVFMIIAQDKKETLLKELYKNFGIDSEAQGIAFSLPVDDMTENLRKQILGK